MMYIVFLSAFQSGVALHKNSEAAGKLAYELVKDGLTPQVASSYRLEDYGYEFEQAFAVRVETEFEAMKLATLAGQFRQVSILMVDVLENNRAYLIPTDDVHRREPLGYLKSSDEQPKGSYTQWRGKYWSIKQDRRPDVHQVPMRTWETQPRNTDEKVFKAKQALVAMYAARAAAVGLSLEVYAKRFQINLKG